MFEPVRGGTRGGQAEFKWSDVSADKDRENYLGHSINAPTGRWQKNKDVHWYSRGVKTSEDERLEEIRRIKEAEADALSVALGFGPSQKGATGSGPGTGANATLVKTEVDLGAELNPEEIERRVIEKEKRRRKVERKEEKRARRESRYARKNNSDNDGDRHARYHDRDRSRSRSPRRHQVGEDATRNLDQEHRLKSSDGRERRGDKDGSRGQDGDYDGRKRELERERNWRRLDDNVRGDRFTEASWGRRDPHINWNPLGLHLQRHAFHQCTQAYNGFAYLPLEFPVSALAVKGRLALHGADSLHSGGAAYTFAYRIAIFPKTYKFSAAMTDMPTLGMPYFLEDKTGTLAGSEFIDVNDRMRLGFRCTLRDTHRTAYMIYDLTNSSQTTYSQPAAVLDYGQNNALGTVIISGRGSTPMSQYLVKLSPFGSSKSRKFIACDGQEYKWSWRSRDDFEWMCLNSSGYLVAYYNLKLAGEPHYPGSSGCMLTVDESYPHLAVGRLVVSFSDLRSITSSLTPRWKLSKAIPQATIEFTLSGTASTLAAELANVLHVPHLALDTIFWNPGWVATPMPDFINKIHAVLKDGETRYGGAKDANKIDIAVFLYRYMNKSCLSKYVRILAGLDPPLALYLPRLCFRTLLRLLGLAPPCSLGCPETTREVFFSRNSIVWWCINHHWSVKKRETERFKVEGIAAGSRMRRLGGWGKETEDWLKAVKETAV
ncbi:hypothetical protein EW146_g2363 [Bondarzewia mesenterica]|uniref:Multiple myeloma tumor-associated protein 2-like N-terminal domain-containing protein n=1 Tax=Bondarzewia mesenterica TaxID=1095465 RepID=A0A4S4M1A8_9AGAM|nr:hypothetical protein EW146_g2363 [Bondarzewia mesenterica]